jgi:pimeloyl-ACP methyl ester carboxylesterase
VTPATPRPFEGPYLDQGAGPPVVLVHGSNTDHRIWAPHAQRIGQRLRVLAPTQRYFGTSPWPDDGRNFSIRTHADDLADFVRAHRLEQVSLVGWSYGAAVSLMMAVQQSELIERLILYEPAIVSFVHAPPDAHAAAADRLAMTAAARARADEGDVSAAVQLFMDGVNDRRGAFDSLPHNVQQIMRDNSRTLPLLFAAPPPGLSCDDLKRLGGMPVVVARGDATRTYYNIAAEWTAACIPASTLVVVPNARHLLPVEDDTRFTALILDLLA